MKRVTSIVAGVVLAGSAIAVPAGVGNADQALSVGCERANEPSRDGIYEGVDVPGPFAAGEQLTVTVEEGDPGSWIALYVGGPFPTVSDPEAPFEIVYTFSTELRLASWFTQAGAVRWSVSCELSPLPADADDDGVPDADDLCPGTTDDSAPDGLKPNRNWLDATATFGCSPTQIIDDAGLGRGHSKFGISTGALADWIANVTG